MEATTLDLESKFKVPGEPFREPANEYWALICLAQGMSFLANRLKHCEKLVCEQIGEDADAAVFSIIGSREEFRVVSLPLITMSFHWYTVSACQFVRTVSAINLPEGLTKKEDIYKFRNEYDKEVIPELLPFRDKVAAHFAGLTKNSNDTPAERKFSLLPPLSFVRGRFMVGANTLTITSGGKTTDSSAITAWSLTRIHERLVERYPLIREITEASSPKPPQLQDLQSHPSESSP